MKYKVTKRLIAQFCSILVLLTIFTNGLSAQEKFQINGVLIPTYEGISMNNVQITNPYTYRFSYGFGAEMKYFLSPKISTNFGLQFNDRGFLAEPKYAYLDDSITTTISISCKYLTIPFDLCINFQPAFRTELFINAGLSYGILLRQTFKGRRVPPELGRPDNGMFEGISNKPSNIKWFDGNYWGVNLGFGVSRYIKSRMVLTVNPGMSFQIDGLLNPQGPVLQTVVTNQGTLTSFDPKLKSFYLQLKLGYYFSDQIENTKKKL